MRRDVNPALHMDPPVSSLTALCGDTCTIPSVGIGVRYTLRSECKIDTAIKPRNASSYNSALTASRTDLRNPSLRPGRPVGGQTSKRLRTRRAAALGIWDPLLRPGATHHPPDRKNGIDLGQPLLERRWCSWIIHGLAGKCLRPVRAGEVIPASSASQYRLQPQERNLGHPY